MADPSERIGQLGIEIASCAVGGAHGSLSRMILADMVELVVLVLTMEFGVRYSRRVAVTIGKMGSHYESSSRRDQVWLGGW